MTRISVIKTPLVFSRFFLIFGAIFTIFGVLLFIRAMSIGFNTKFPSGDWNAIIFTFQGFLFIIMGASNLVNRKYFIEWDDNKLCYYLPGTEKPETLQFEEMESVEIKLFQILIGTKTRIVTLDLDTLQFEDLKKIKEKFETISGSHK